MDFPMDLDGGKKDKDEDKNAEGKRERKEDEKDQNERALKTPNLPLSVSLRSPNPSPTKLDTFSGTIGQGATFAVWNLCDLGGGFQSTHWTKNNEAAIKLLPDELKLIGA